MGGPVLHRLALFAGFASVAPFLVLLHLAGTYNAALANVARADWLALALLGVGGFAHVLRFARAAH